MSERHAEEPAEHPTQKPAEPGRALRIAVVLLVAASGGVEAVSFLALDHVFAGVMTSNLALLGMAAGQRQAPDVTAAILALAGFGTGAAVVGRFTRRSTGAVAHWPRRVMFCLAAEAVVLAAGAGVWAAAGGAPGERTRDVLQFGAAVAMGAQSAAMVAAGRAAAPTTYLTGTLATYIVKGVGTGRPTAWVPLRLGALIIGAGVCAVLLRAAPGWAAVPPVVLTVCAVLTARAPLAAGRRRAGRT